MNADNREGRIYAFAITIALICGLQNELGCDVNNPEYQAYQKVLTLVKKELNDAEKKK